VNGVEGDRGCNRCARPKECAWSIKGELTWNEEKAEGEELVGPRKGRNDPSSRGECEVILRRGLRSHRYHTSAIHNGG
jgi:hypothetical protein